MFDALANEHRRECVRLLALGPRSISDLAGRRGLSLPAIHKHVRILEAAGLVQRRKLGRVNVLALRREPLRGVSEWVAGFDPWWGTDDESLDNYTEYLTKETT